jgi:hypothetical protein
MYSKLKMLEKRCETHQQKKVVADFEQLEARLANTRTHYANLKPEQMQAIHDYQKLLYANMTVEQRHAKRNHEKTRCVIRQNTLSKKIYRRVIHQILTDETIFR